MGTRSNEVRHQGNTRGRTCYRATGVRSDTVMASHIDGPSHKWAVQSVTSHDTVPIEGSRDSAATLHYLSAYLLFALISPSNLTGP